MQETLEVGITKGDDMKSGKSLPFFDPKDSERRDPNVIGIGICIYNVSEISHVEGKFQATVRLMMKWYVEEFRGNMPKTEFREYLDMKNADLAKKMNIPDYTPNMLMEIQEMQRYAYLDRNDAPGVVTMQVVTNAWFAMQECNVHEFPFDVTELTFLYRLWDNEKNLERYFEQLERPDDTFYLTPFKSDFTMQEFYILQPEPVIYKNTKLLGASTYKAAPLLRRKATYYNSRIVQRMTLLTTLALTSFAMQPIALGERASVILTVSLTVIAFQFIISEDIPKVSYRTWLDRVINFNFGFLATILLQQSITGLLARMTASNLLPPLQIFEMESEWSLVVDAVSFLLFLTFWVLYNGSIVFQMWKYNNELLKPEIADKVLIPRNFKETIKVKKVKDI